MSRVRGQTYVYPLHCFICFAVGSDVSILRAPLAAASGPSQHMMSDNVNDEDRPQQRELRPLLFLE